MAIGGHGLTTVQFTSSGNWVCPAGVTRVILIGQGAGQGGQGGSTLINVPARGGKGTVPCMKVISVVPNTTYAITIGTGGSGTTSGGVLGGSGGDTLFAGLATFPGANSTYELTGSGTGITPGGINNPLTSGQSIPNGVWGQSIPSFGGNSAGSNPNYRPGGSAGGGSKDAGGTGGNANNSGAGSAGGTPSGYGCGGGAGGNGSTVGGTGGNGGPGMLFICWGEELFKKKRFY